MSNPQRSRAYRGRERRRGRPAHRWPLGELGLTLVELLTVVALIATLTALVTPPLLATLARNREERAVRDIQLLQFDVRIFRDLKGELPADLSELDRPLPRDPWGRPYEYFVFRGPDWRGTARKDRFLVPLNSEYDLYSRGPDGETASPLTARASRDDIVMANDGAFIGRASEF